MKILFVAFPFSIHTVRWISQLEGQGWELHLFSSMTGALPHEQLGAATFHEHFYYVPRGHQKPFEPLAFRPLALLRRFGLSGLFGKAARFLHLEKGRPDELARLIKHIRPDIIHSLETQHAGYLVSEVKRSWSGPFPRWIHSNWGIDMHYFGVIPEHTPKINEMLAGIDTLVVEGRRDAELARQYGFNKRTVTFPSVGGGIKIPAGGLLPASKRRKILVKGMQDKVRRGLVALRALERCAELLKDYEIVLYSSNETTREAAHHFFHRTGKGITILPTVSNEELLRLNAEARLNITVNMSDGLPNSMLEAMTMGAFPVQSSTSIADEWIRDGVTGMLVPPEDPDRIELAIREALLNDRMVDEAQQVNRDTVRQRLDYETIKRQAIELYTVN